MKKISFLLLMCCFSLLSLTAFADNAAKGLYDRNSYDFTEGSVYWQEYNQSNHAPIGTTLWMKFSSTETDDEMYVELCIEEVLRGEEALDFAVSKGYESEELREDFELIYVRLLFSMQCRDEKSVFQIDMNDFAFIRERGSYTTTQCEGFDASLLLSSNESGIFELCMPVRVDDEITLIYRQRVWLSVSAPNKKTGPGPELNP